MATETKKTQNNKKQKRKFKMPSSLAIIVGVVIFVTILTWIPHNGFGITDVSGIPVGDWQSGSLADWQNYIYWTNVNAGMDGAAVIDAFGLQGHFDKGANLFVTEVSNTFWLTDFNDGTSSMFGIFDSFKAMIGGYQDAWEVGFYLVGIYAIVLLLMQTETLKDGISSLVKMLGGKELVLVPVLFVLFALGGTLFGMQEETLGLIPIIVPVLIVAGFDAPVGLMVAALGTTTGIAASFLDPFSVGVMAEGLGTKISTALLERGFLFILYTSIGATFVTIYAARVRRNPSKSFEKEAVEENKIWAKENIGDITEHERMSAAQRTSLIIFAVVFAWMVFSLLPWNTWFQDMDLEHNKGWIIFSSLFYGKVLLGEWYFVELGILFFVAAFIIAKLFKKSTQEFMKICWDSLKGMFGVITIIAFSRATSAILQNSGLTYGMVYLMANPEQLKDFSTIGFTLIWLLIFTFMAVFIPSTSGLAGITAPLVGAFFQNTTGGAVDPKIVGILMAYPLAQGVINMFSPSTGLIVIQAEQSKVNYGKILPVLAGYAAVIFAVGTLAITAIIGIESM